jgi:hypothetical protein
VTKGRPGLDGIDPMAFPEGDAQQWRCFPRTVDSDRRQSPAAADICRGVARLFRAHALAGVSELALANGRRADFVGLSHGGSIWIVEIKSCLGDFRCDRKWSTYRDYCDRLFFAVAPGFPHEVLPLAAGLIIADRHGGEIVRPAPEHKLAAARRRTMTLRLARTAALRLHALSDPGLDVV